MIKINGLNKKYKSKIILDNISTVFERNKFNFILGRNGAGKTTLFKCLLNLEAYTGEILYDNSRFNNMIGEIYGIYDDMPFYNNLSGLQNIRILVGKNEIDMDKYSHILNQSNINLKSKVKNYSFGQKKLLSIIIAGMLKPKFLILDEISNGIDYDSSKWIKANIKNIFKEVTIICSGHQFDFYQDLIDNLYVIKERDIKQIDYDGRKELASIYEEFVV